MKKNIGTPDRVIRLLISLVLFFFAWWLPSWIVLALALFTLYESLAGWCIFYQLIGKNTCPLPSTREPPVDRSFEDQ
ncbi:YgaP family membrane protein [Candidatus Protochlamydia phocaeensis]|uniref:YgaP family membrane protein n=1 Tax=Candidatus Protochlamydia phocaeensis TaxID=1414722 RepID=UPI0008394294|nr:DUF2892 domain-containing protein [Candidatus Protochlamydia phocaeensis]